MCKRGEIYNVDFKKDIGSRKQYGKRPALIVSNNKANRFSPVITVVPLTAKTWKKRSQPTHVVIPCGEDSGLQYSSLALAEQVETIDKSELLEYKGYVSDRDVMDEVTRAIQIQVGVFEEFN